MSRKPRIFIGSSVEGLKIADAINLNLDHELEVILWRTGTFDLSSTAVDSLVSRSSDVDFALFVFSPDDVATIRSIQRKTVRDNVLFELGVFIGALGKNRCFVVKPRNVDLHFPTDLLGLTPADYEAERSDGDLAAAVNHACVQVKRMVEKVGLRVGAKEVSAVRTIKPSDSSALQDSDYLLLEKLLTTVTRHTGGVSLGQIEGSRRSGKQPSVDLAAIRLERAGLVERTVETNQDGWDYFVYSITEQGIEELVNSGQWRNTAEDFVDDDMPF
jgi:hypothetical protein